MNRLIMAGDRVRYPFDRTAGVVIRLVTRHCQELAVVAFDGKALTREVPVSALERVR